MLLIATTAGLICLLTWLYLLLAHGSFWRVELLMPPASGLAQVSGAVAVIIPASDEADVIGQTISSLLTQTCATSIRIFVVDDHSSDGTAGVVRQAALSCTNSNAVEVIPGSPLPAGSRAKFRA